MFRSGLGIVLAGEKKIPSKFQEVVIDLVVKIFSETKGVIIDCYVADEWVVIRQGNRAVLLWQDGSFLKWRLEVGRQPTELQFHRLTSPSRKENVASDIEWLLRKQIQYLFF